MNKKILSAIRTVCVLAALLAGRQAKAQLVADFTASPVQGCAPLVVQFTDASAGSPTTWFWDLGNGNTSISQNPGTIYFSPGVYAVKLVVKTASDADSVVKTDFITVNSQPAVNFKAIDTVGCSPFLANFKDLSLPLSGSLTQWQWDFGDGNTSTVQSPVNLFTTPGTYNITLQVFNSGGCSGTLTKTAYIKVLESPVAAFTTKSATSCSPPVTVFYTNTSAGSNITSYNWDFGDAGTSAVANPSHNFTTPGAFNTMLIVTNQAGCTDTVLKIISIGAVMPGFTVPDTTCAGTAISVINTSSPSSVSASWSFGDGTISTDVNPIKTYATAGIFTIKLVNNFGACTDSISKNIVVVNHPIADFIYSAPPAGCTVPITVNFTSTSTGAATYLWNFGDGATSTLASPSHTYSLRGVYTIKLTVKNGYGCTDIKVLQNIISITNPQINSITGLPYIGCVPFTNTFYAQITTPEPISTYLWNFGDNTTSTSPVPVHTYNATGTYDVSLTITTVNGCAVTYVDHGAVTIGDRPIASFIATPLAGCAYEQVQFTNTSTGITTAWQWSFGDTTSSGAENPLHHYIDTGFFSVTFIAENNGCKDTIIKQNYIYIKPPISYFKIRNYCDTPFVKRFTSLSKGAITYLWDFGDGSTSTTKNPAHTYVATGTYTVKLRVDNAPCYDEFTDTVYVIDERPVINVNSATICRGGTISISAAGTTPANIKRYLWDFGDTSIPVTTLIPQVNHVYTTPGIYNITLTTTDQLGCKKTITKTAGITVYGPIAGLLHSAGGCAASAITFSDVSQPYPGFPITVRTIDFGDGVIATPSTAAFSHTYAATGTFIITFTVKDSYGCTDMLTDSVVVSIARAKFSISDTISCRQSLVKFQSTSTGSGLTYKWNFGDGNTGIGKTPSHIYAADGVYSVSLTITDRYGCSDSITKSNLVTISNASAAFTMSDSLINCPPAQISFTNGSASYSSLKWFFDDGSTSTLVNPTHFFLNGGIYNVKLLVYGHGSCVDSAIHQVLVKGPQGSITYAPTGHCAPAKISFTATASNITGKFIWDFGDGTTVIATGNTTTHTYTNVGQYVPRLLLQNTVTNCNISVFGKDTISVSSATAFIKQPPLAFCDSGRISFYDSSAIRYDSVTSYMWKFGDGATSNQQNPMHYYAAPGNYIVTMSLATKYSCRDTTQPTIIKVVKSPAVSISGADSVCVNTPVAFAVTLAQPDTSATSYSWTFGNGSTSTLPNPLMQIYTVANNYVIKVSAINSGGCTDTAFKNLLVLVLPPVNGGPDTTICLGQSVMLMASGGQIYTWQSNTTLSCTACNSPVATPVDSLVKYVVQATGASGCINTDTVSVTVLQPFTLVTSLRDTLCRGQSAVLSASGAYSYTWSPVAGLSNANIPNPMAAPDTTTIYQVAGSDFKNCFSDTAYIPVIVYPVPQFNIVPDVLSVIIGSSATLATTGSADIISYTWTPAGGLSCTTCPQPLVTPTENTTYVAVVKNAGNCIARDQVIINLICGSGNVFIPNTFSPNGDGSNDIFYPRGKGVNGIKNMIIYNRWGAVIFQRNSFNINDEAAGWDGTYKGQPALQDVYVYYMQIICANGEKFLYKGNVTLIR